jgi:uncharacterized membrane protein YraQ (UPF0718 family)
VTTEARIDDRVRTGVPAAIALLGALVLGLFYYKWGASLRALSATRSSGHLNLALDPFLSPNVLSATSAYVRKIWIALLFGVLLGGTLRVAVSPRTVTEWLGRRGARSIVIAAVTGAPLMLCSCCVTPIVAGLNRRGARLGSSLALLFAAPGLNVAALALTFMLFPAGHAVLRVAAALALVFGAAPLIGRYLDGRRRAEGHPELRVPEVEEPLTWRSLPRRWLGSVAYTAGMTVPILIIGVALSSALLPHLPQISSMNAFVSIGVVALLATLVALPTFLEIPLALSLALAGAPAGAIVALLIAGPIVNMPSLLVLGREVGKRAAALVFVSVWLTASIAGFICEGFPS